MENLLQSRSLIDRSYWLIRLRWVAIAGLLGATFVASEIMGVTLPTVKLYILGLVLLFYNFVLYDLMRWVTWGDKTPPPAKVNRIVTFQISVDLLILTVILHLSGGIENPFLLYFVFHMVLASVLLTRLQSYLQATLAVFLFGLLILLEYRGVLPHYTLNGFIDGAHYRSGLFVLGTFIVFATTIYLVVYMTTSISEQLRIQQQELEDANALLHQKDNLKNEYVLRLTHDIRGHLSAIQSCLDIVIDGLVGPLNDRQQDLVERSHRRSSKCLNFITALLRLTRMKLTGRLDKEMFPIAHIVYDALAAVDRRAASKQIELSHEFDEGVDEIYGEPVLLEETLTNILFNAVRYTPDGGKIALSVRSTEEGILIEVSDTGIGIPAGELEKIFEEFHRADNARRIERDGTGLGLSIARQVIERHGGRIWASNNDEVGSTFSIILPRDPAK